MTIFRPLSSVVGLLLILTDIVAALLLAADLAVTAGYLGSHGTDLRISRNINQPVNGVRPYRALSATSPMWRS